MYVVVHMQLCACSPTAVMFDQDFWFSSSVQLSACDASRKSSMQRLQNSTSPCFAHVVVMVTSFVQWHLMQGLHVLCVFRSAR
jgi:hypothetical protein